MQIIPSILEPNPQDYINQILRLSPYFNHFQIDIADGILVPNKTAGLNEILHLLTNNQQPFDLTQGKPTTDNHFDFHLMVSNPASYIDTIRALKQNIHIDTIFFHYKALSSNAPFSYLASTYSSVANLGLVLNPEDEVEVVNNAVPIDIIPIIQIMTIHPGMQGNPFLVQTLKKIEQLRKLGYRNKITVDGGVNLETIQIMISQNQIPDIVCPGSYFSKANNKGLKERVEKINQVIAILKNAKNADFF